MVHIPTSIPPINKEDKKFMTSMVGNVLHHGSAAMLMAFSIVTRTSSNSRFILGKYHINVSVIF